MEEQAKYLQQDGKDKEFIEEIEAVFVKYGITDVFLFVYNQDTGRGRAYVNGNETVVSEVLGDVMAKENLSFNIFSKATDKAKNIRFKTNKNLN